MASRSGGLALAPGTGTGPIEVAGAGPTATARVIGLSRSFDGRGILRGVDLEVQPGEIVALLGRSGSGKSTLLRALAGLDQYFTGSVEVSGQVAVAFQEPRLLPWKKVLPNVLLGLRSQGQGTPPEQMALNALEEVGLTARAGAWPLTLSGGEAQRASLARALVRQPQLLLLDEPFCALDALTRIAMHDLLLRLWESHKPAVLMVTHDVDEALSLADRAVVLRDGRIASQFYIKAPRPRDRHDPNILDLRDQLLGELGIDTKGTL